MAAKAIDIVFAGRGRSAGRRRKDISVLWLGAQVGRALYGSGRVGASEDVYVLKCADDWVEV